MKSIKRVLIAWLVVGVVALTSTGCMNKDVIVAKINGQNVSEPLYRIFLWAAQRGLESLQPDFWELDSVEGKTPEEYAKDKALQSATYCMIVHQKAEELNLKLSDDEKTRIKTAAKEAMKSNAALAKQYQIKQKDYETYYTYATQNDKVKQVLGESYEPNIDEINQMQQLMQINGEWPVEATMIHVLFNTTNELGEDIPGDKKQQVYEEAQRVLKRALAGESMEDLAAQYSDDPLVTRNGGEYTFVSGSMEAVIEEIVFNEAYLGRVYPELVETSLGYEIIKVLSVSEESETLAKQRAIERVKEDFSEEELSQMMEVAEIKKMPAYDLVEKMDIIVED